MSWNDRHPPGMLAGQPLGWLAYAIGLGLTGLVWRRIGAGHPLWFWLTVLTPVVHQLYVWLAWRLELRSKAVSRSIGFTGYVVLFFVGFVMRFVTMATLCVVDYGSLGLTSSLRIAFVVVLGAPALYAFWSVIRYFGMKRAAGADHFDPKYRDLPRVNEGIFRFTSNGMYVYVFLGFWAVAAAADSKLAVLAAAFSHFAIWVHYFTTEKPDMSWIYGDPGENPDTP